MYTIQQVLSLFWQPFFVLYLHILTVLWFDKLSPVLSGHLWDLVGVYNIIVGLFCKCNKHNFNICDLFLLFTKTTVA